MSRKNSIRKAFNKAASSYNTNAVLQHEVGERLIDRLDFFTLKPKKILDLGMGTGFITSQIAQKYPEAEVFGIDFAENMLKEAQKNILANNINLICADLAHLPIEENSVDLIFSNFTFQWSDNLTDLFKQCYKLLKTNGLIFFSIPGPDTLCELKSVLHTVDRDYNHINNFMDMHDIGDILVQTKFAHPVMDSDYFTLTYSNIKNIFKDLKNIGANTIIGSNPRKTLFGKNRFNKISEEYNKYLQEDNKYPLTYEVIYGHAFKSDKPVKMKYPELSEVSVPIEKIIKQQS